MSLEIEFFKVNEKECRISYSAIIMHINRFAESAHLNLIKTKFRNTVLLKYSTRIALNECPTNVLNKEHP